MTNLLVLSYGSQREYQRAVLAVLSFFSFYSQPFSEVQVLIFTDQQEYFERCLQGLPVDYVILSAAQQTEMMGAVGYRHRIKAVVVGNTLERFPDRQLLFFDSDTFFVQDPAPLLARIKPGTSVLHTVEFTFNDIRYQALPNGRTVADFVGVLEQQEFTTTHGSERFSGTQECWNSGVLGLDATVAAYMPDVYQLIDYFYAQSHWHITEQIAFSLVLQTRNHLLPALSYVYHYWEGDKKTAADSLLSQFLTPDFIAQPLSSRLAAVGKLTEQLPTAIEQYLVDHPEITLKQQAITAFNADSFWLGYRKAFAYLRRVPSDQKFLKDVLYHTKRAVS